MPINGYKCLFSVRTFISAPIWTLFSVLKFRFRVRLRWLFTLPASIGCSGLSVQPSPPVQPTTASTRTGRSFSATRGAILNCGGLLLGPLFSHQWLLNCTPCALQADSTVQLHLLTPYNSNCWWALTNAFPSKVCSAAEHLLKNARQVRASVLFSRVETPWLFKLDIVVNDKIARAAPNSPRVSWVY